MVTIKLRPIGIVESPFRNPKDLHFACEEGRFTDTESSIVINQEFAKGLKGLDDFSHIWVIYHLHKADQTELSTHPGPPNINDLPIVGVFASRSQYRPNHLALRMVNLVKVDRNEIFVKGLDAIDGSPVVDIKPYVPFFDKTQKQKIAEWYRWTNEAQSILTNKHG